MDFNKVMTALKNVQSPLWVNGRKVDKLEKLDVWEYTARVPGVGDVLVRGVDTNNLKVKLANASVAVDGRLVKLDNIQYLDLFDQMGYLYNVVQPARMQQNGMIK